MISGKGVLYTVLVAASAAAIIGTVLTGGARGEKLRSIRSGIQNFLGALTGRKSMTGSSDSMQRAEYDQANSMGHS